MKESSLIRLIAVIGVLAGVVLLVIVLSTKSSTPHKVKPPVAPNVGHAPPPASTTPAPAHAQTQQPCTGGNACEKKVCDATSCSASISAVHYDISADISATGPPQAQQVTSQIALDPGATFDCQNYTAPSAHFVQFVASTVPVGLAVTKVVSYTQRYDTLDQARQALSGLQPCVEAPYMFDTRGGYDLTQAQVDGHTVYRGVVRDCNSGPPSGQSDPCLVSKVLIESDKADKLTIAIPFVVGFEDPKFKCC